MYKGTIYSLVASHDLIDIEKRKHFPSIMFPTNRNIEKWLIKDHQHHNPLHVPPVQPVLPPAQPVVLPAQPGQPPQLK